MAIYLAPQETNDAGGPGNPKPTWSHVLRGRVGPTQPDGQPWPGDGEEILLREPARPATRRSVRVRYNRVRHRRSPGTTSPPSAWSPAWN